MFLIAWDLQFVQALLEYEKHKKQSGELQLPVGPFSQSTSVEKEVEFSFCVVDLNAYNFLS